MTSRPGKALKQSQPLSQLNSKPSELEPIETIDKLEEGKDGLMNSKIQVKPETAPKNDKIIVKYFNDNANTDDSIEDTINYIRYNQNKNSNKFYDVEVMIDKDFEKDYGLFVMLEITIFKEELNQSKTNSSGNQDNPPILIVPGSSSGTKSDRFSFKSKANRESVIAPNQNPGTVIHVGPTEVNIDDKIDILKTGKIRNLREMADITEAKGTEGDDNKPIDPLKKDLRIFAKKINFEYPVGTRLFLKFLIYKVPKENSKLVETKKVEDYDFYTKPEEFTQEKWTNVKLNVGVFNRADNKSTGKNLTAVITECSYEPKKTKMTVEVAKLVKEIEMFFTISMTTEGSTTFDLYRSEKIRNEMNKIVPFKSFKFNTARLNDNSYVQFVLYEIKKDGEFQVVGQNKVNWGSITQKNKTTELELISTSSSYKIGMLRISGVDNDDELTFVSRLCNDYSIIPIIGYDFSEPIFDNADKEVDDKSFYEIINKSNLPHPESRIHQEKMKIYRYTSTIIRTLDPLSRDNQYPTFCFGARLPPSFKTVSNLFAMNGKFFSPLIEHTSIERQISDLKSKKQFMSYGPCIGHEILQYAIDLAKKYEEEKDNKSYVVLLLFIESYFQDQSVITRLLAENANLPLSVIICSPKIPDKNSKSELSEKMKKLISDITNYDSKNQTRKVIEVRLGAEVEKEPKNPSKVHRTIPEDIQKINRQNILHFFELNESDKINQIGKDHFNARKMIAKLPIKFKTYFDLHSGKGHGSKTKAGMNSNNPNMKDQRQLGEHTTPSLVTNEQEKHQVSKNKVLDTFLQKRFNDFKKTLEQNGFSSEFNKELTQTHHLFSDNVNLVGEILGEMELYNQTFPHRLLDSNAEKRTDLITPPQPVASKLNEDAFASALISKPLGVPDNQKSIPVTKNSILCEYATEDYIRERIRELNTRTVHTEFCEKKTREETKIIRFNRKHFSNDLYEEFSKKIKEKYKEQEVKYKIIKNGLRKGKSILLENTVPFDKTNSLYASKIGKFEADFSRQKCVECYKNYLEIIFMDCAHILYCLSCYENLDRPNVCDLCANPINSVLLINRGDFKVNSDVEKENVHLTPEPRHSKMRRDLLQSICGKWDQSFIPENDVDANDKHNDSLMEDNLSDGEYMDLSSEELC